jgi:hypothetical protein
VGLRDIFGGGGDRAKTKLSKLVKAAINPYAQSADRYGAMEQLIELAAKSDDDETAQCYVGLLRRFTVTSSKTIEDEEEKGWVYRRLTAIGKPALRAVKQFCLANENIAWALRVLEDVANENQEWEILDALLEAHPPGYENPDKKVQFLTHLREIDNPRVPGLLASYLDDLDETVRFHCVESMIDIAELESLAPLVGRLANDEEDSLRLRTRILDGLTDLDWDVGEHKDAISVNLGNEHILQSNRVKRR